MMPELLSYALIYCISSLNKFLMNHKFKEFYLLGHNAVRSAKSQQTCYLVHAAFLLGLFFDAEGGGNMFP
jgi:hypothetical protein